MTAQSGTHPLHLLAALGAGTLMTAMVHLNGELARHGGPLFSSWCAHALGTVAAMVALLVLRRQAAAPEGAARAPAWAYLGGLSGAVTVIFTSVAVNSQLALAGTLALGLVGQSLFSLAADRWGLFGMARRIPGPRELMALGLILAGSLVIVLASRSAP